MGAGESKVETKIIDNTDKVRAEREAQLNFAATEKRKAEEAEKKRNQDEAEKKRNQDEAERKRKEDTERKMVEKKLEEDKARLAQVDVETDKLKTYKLGDMTHFSNFRDLDISDVNYVRIGLFGPSGSGKSCFINTCYRTLMKTGRGPSNPQDMGGEGTVILEDYLKNFFFRLVDTRGFFHFSDGESAEFLDVMQGHIADGDEMIRGDEDYEGPVHQEVEFSNRVHSVILVVNATDPRLIDKLRTNMTLNRKYLSGNVTHEDKINKEMREKVLEAASRATGSPENQTFFIANYTKDNCPRDPNTEEQVLIVLQYALGAVERAVKVHKLRDQHKAKQQANSVNVVGIKVVSSVPGDNGKSRSFTVTKDARFDSLKSAIKHVFKMDIMKAYYFSDSEKEGQIFEDSYNIVETLGTSTTVYLHKSDSI